ncbi:MAG: hypothetical protein HYW89_00915 [Candidatus Sungiibacteriota bacterium]|uniref:Uncharacterized protein n=1 Tax=Candidatus Sungiibacteriota bacterium TaxID=2750080 RepID=A0A7T5URG0_9BACT|nr:MAG: hypothetical protein HYW89_00915 [Candidatus Sungbacteria bacterium]
MRKHTSSRHILSKKTTRRANFRTPRLKSTTSFIFALVLGATLAVGVSVWATTIGNNVSVGGTLTSTGNVSANADLSVTSGARIGADSDPGHITSLADDSFFVEGQAEFDGIVWFDGTLHASSTLLVGAAATFYGNVTIGDAAADTLTVTSNSVTFSNSATATVNTNVLNGFSFATSTASYGLPLLAVGSQSAGRPARVGIATSTPSAMFAVNSFGGLNALVIGSSSASSTFVVDSQARIGIGTSTPGAKLSVDGDGLVLISSQAATATLRIYSSSPATGANGKGGCIEMEDVDGNVFSLVATTTNGPAVWQGAACR